MPKYSERWQRWKPPIKPTLNLEKRHLLTKKPGKPSSVLVKPVPLPGRDATSVVDPLTIPGLEPNRVFVTDGVASVPLPGPTHENTVPTPAVVQEASPRRGCTHPSVHARFRRPLRGRHREPVGRARGGTCHCEPRPPRFGRPLRRAPEPQPASPPSASIELPDLPDLDSLF